MATPSQAASAPPTGAGPAAPSLSPFSPVLSVCFSHPHIVSVDRVDAAGRLEVVAQTPSLSARQWLRDRGSITAGEAVTLLVPLLSALRHVERRSLDRRLDAVSSITLDDVVIDERGAPVVAGLRPAPADAVLPVAPTEGEARSRAAVRASGVAARLIDDVLSMTGGGDAQALAVLGRLCRQAPATSVDEFVEVVSDLAIPAALSTHGIGGSCTTSAGRRLAASPTETDIGGRSISRGPRGRRPPREMVGQTVASLRQVRARTWLVAGGVAVSVVLGTWVFGEPGAESPRPEVSAARGLGIEGGAVKPGVSSTPTAGRATGTTAPTDAAQAVTGDDPAAAATVLLAARARCLRDLDAECLTALDQQGSPTIEHDLAAIETPENLGGVAVDIESTTLVNRLGDAALFTALTRRGDKSEPASALIIRTEAGWRVRDVRPAGASG